MKYGLSDKQLKEIINKISGFPEIEEAVLFGSRAIDTYKEASDVDIALKGNKVKAALAAKLKFAFEEDTYLPFFFDFVAYPTITNEKLKEHINKKGVVIYRKTLPGHDNTIKISEHDLKDYKMNTVKTNTVKKDTHSILYIRESGKSCSDNGGRSEWQNTTLGDITIRITKGTTPPGGKGFVEHGINYIKSESLSYDGKIDTSKFVCIDTATHDKLKRSQLEENDILFSMAGVFLGKTGLITRDMLPANTNQAAAIIRLKKDKGIPKFVGYFLRQPSIITYVNNMSGQSAQPNINFQEIASIEILLPPLPEQRTIASVLSSLDDKIDLLHRQNKTLEAMAETLFRQWFVEEADKGWKEDSLLSLIELVGGGTPKTAIAEYWDGDVPWLSGGDISSNHKSFVLKADKNITELGLSNSPAKVLPGYATVISARGTVGKYCMLAKPMAFSQSNYGVLPRGSNCFFFTYLLINHVVEELQSSAYGSVFDTITTNTFRDIKVGLPPESPIAHFESKVSCYFNKIILNKNQIHSLEKLRDTLLPKLMSGEVRVTV